MPGVLVTLIPGIPRGWAISFILLHFLNPNKTEQNIPKYSTPIVGCHTLIKLQFSSAQAVHVSMICMLLACCYPVASILLMCFNTFSMSLACCNT